MKKLLPLLSWLRIPLLAVAALLFLATGAEAQVCVTQQSNGALDLCVDLGTLSSDMTGGFTWNVTAATCTADGGGGALTVNGSNEIVCSADNTGAGTANILDLGDDGGNDSTDLVEIAVTGDTNSIFTESAADKLLIAVGSDWPKSDTADDLTCTNCIGPEEITDLALGTDTSGNYAAGDAEAGAALTGDSATAFFSSGTVDDARIDGSAEADEVNPILGSQTQGNYVDDVTAGIGIAVTHSAGEGSDAAVALTFADAGADPVLGAAGATFSSEGASAAGLVFEGDTNDTFETRIRVTDPTAERIVTIPDADSTTVQPDAGAASNFLTAVSSAGVISKAQPAFSDISGTVSDTQIADGAVDGGNAGEIADGSVTADDLGTDSVGADELNATGVESELEAVLDLAGLQDRDIDSLTGQGDIDTAFVFDAVDVDFETAAGDAFPRLLNDASPDAADCDAVGESGRLLFDTDLDTDGSVMVCLGAGGWKDIDDDGAGGGGDSIEIEDGDNAGTFTAIDTTARFDDSGDIGFTFADGGAGGPDVVTATIRTGTVSTDEIGTAGVAADEIATDAVGAAELSSSAIEAGDIGTADLPLQTKSMYWSAGSMSADGTQCQNPTETTINSGPKVYTVICTDNDAATLYGHVVMPDGWDAGTVTLELEYLQTAADTNPMNSDVAAMCRGAGETVNNTWGSEVAIDDANVSGSNIVDLTTSAAVTANGTCAAGDVLWWRWQLDAAGTTTAVATLHIIGMKMEYGWTATD